MKFRVEGVGLSKDSLHNRDLGVSGIKVGGLLAFGMLHTNLTRNPPGHVDLGGGRGSRVRVCVSQNVLYPVDGPLLSLSSPNILQ